MNLSELESLNNQFQQTFGVTMWRYQTKTTGFDIEQFEIEKCRDIKDGVSIKEYVNTVYGGKAVELVETLLTLGNWHKICQSIGYTIVSESKKTYLGAVKLELELPIVESSSYNNPISSKRYDAYRFGPLAMINVGWYWRLIHLPSTLSCGNYKGLKSAKEAIAIMKKAATFETIDQTQPSEECIDSLVQLMQHS